MVRFSNMQTNRVGQLETATCGDDSKFSASASEIFAGAIKDYGRGIVVVTLQRTVKDRPDSNGFRATTVCLTLTTVL